MTKDHFQDQYDIEKVQKNVRKGIVYWQIQDNLKDPQGLSSIHRQRPGAAIRQSQVLI